MPQIYIGDVGADAVHGIFGGLGDTATEGAQLPVLRKTELSLPVLRREWQGQVAVRLRRTRALPVQELLAARGHLLTHIRQ